MGITGELVRSVFSRSRSVATHESNARCNAVEKKRWTSVRSYLCGDEYNSVLAEEDSTSIKSSEATVTQPIVEDSVMDRESVQSKDIKKEMPGDKPNSMSRPLEKEDAACIIQAAFRDFLVSRRRDQPKQEPDVEAKSPSRESIGTCVEVQTGNSVEVLSIHQESTALQAQQKSRSQVLRQKEDWDDSTVSSNIIRMRIQNRLEATTRRERALAYAFAQQLRICSKKKKARLHDAESNMTWSWLERWMATRMPENSSVDDQMSKQMEPSGSTLFKRKPFDVGGEEKESCGSNEVSVQVDKASIVEPIGQVFKPDKNRTKATRNVLRRKTIPSYRCPKVAKKESQRDAVKEKFRKQKQSAAISGESKCKDNACQLIA